MHSVCAYSQPLVSVLFIVEVPENLKIFHALTSFDVVDQSSFIQIILNYCGGVYLQRDGDCRLLHAKYKHNQSHQPFLRYEQPNFCNFSLLFLFFVFSHNKNLSNWQTHTQIQLLITLIGHPIIIPFIGSNQTEIFELITLIQLLKLKILLLIYHHRLVTNLNCTTCPYRSLCNCCAFPIPISFCTRRFHL